ncbi:hypothetical protein HK100_005249, partial [Physocladia obscura]
MRMLKTDPKYDDGICDFLASAFANAFMKMTEVSSKIEHKYWMEWPCLLMQDFPVLVLKKIITISRDKIEESWSAVSFDDFFGEDGSKMRNLVEVSCIAVTIISRELSAKGKFDGMDFGNECVGLYDLILKQLKSFLSYKEDIYQIELFGRESMSSSEPGKDILFLASLRTSLMNRLKILSSLMPLLATNLESFNPLQTVEVLILLSVSDLVHHCEKSLGDIVLDYAIYILESDSQKQPELRVKLAQIQDLQPKLFLCQSMAKRLARILPFNFESIYMKNSISTFEFSSKTAISTAGLECNMIWNPTLHFQPFRWIEDRKYSVQTTSINIGNTKVANSEHEGEASVKDIGKNQINDTPISLSLFGASVSTQQALGAQLKRSGWKQEDVDD